MSNLIWLPEAQIAGQSDTFDSRVVSAVVLVIRNGLRRRDTPLHIGPRITFYNRFIR